MLFVLLNYRSTDLFKDWPDKALNDLCLISKRNQVLQCVVNVVKEYKIHMGPIYRNRRGAKRGLAPVMVMIILCI